MAGSGVSLFPRAVPTVALPNPRNRRPSLHEVDHVPRVPDEPLPTNAIPQSNQEHVPHNGTFAGFQRSRSPSGEECIGVAITTSSPLDGLTPSLSIPPPPKTRPRFMDSPKPSSPEPNSGRSGSQTLVDGANSAKSPVVPIRSMFPTFNPTVPLSQQQYYPQRPYPTRMSSIARNLSREEYRSSMTTPIDRAVGNRTAPASLLNFPSDVMSISEPQYSSHRELEKLWEASHGTEPGNLLKSFDLEMARTTEATFTFGADPHFPFYTLKTFDTSEICISKTNPTKRNVTQDILMSALEPPERRFPPHDGLVAFIFPKMAAMLALNQSAALAKQHHLASTDKDDIEQAAMRRAAEQESCHLRWNHDAQRYEFDHPAIARHIRDPDFLRSPASPELGSIKPVLHISVSSHTFGSPITSASNPPVIVVTNPYVAPPSEPPQSGIRLSTIPQSDHDAPLASLDLGSMTLHINANQILTLMPSLFAVDALVSAILAIAVADETTNPVLGAMDIWTPRAGGTIGSPNPSAGVGRKRGYAPSVVSQAGSKLYATIAEREEAEEEALQMRKEHNKDIKASRKSSKYEYTGKRTWYGAKQKRRLSSAERSGKGKKKQVVMGEFDLEKLGHYQSGARKGEELPAVTRGVMAGLVAMLRFIVWCLTAVVGFICWLLHVGTRGVTSEKF